MNTLARPVYLLAVTLLLSGCAVGEKHRLTVKKQWPGEGVERVEVRGINGAVRVEATDAGPVVLVADVAARGIAPTDEENHGYFTTELSGGTLRVEQKRRRMRGFPFHIGSDLEIDYSLRVPRELAVDLTTVNGRIVTRGVSGDTRLKSVNGAIDAEVAGSQELEAQTVNGRIRATFRDDFRGAALKTVNGGVQAVLPVSASFRCDLAQVNGDFEASFPLSIHSHPGRRRVSGEVNGGRYRLKITTVNGSVRVQQGAPAPPQPPAPPEKSITPVPPPPPPPVS